MKKRMLMVALIMVLTFVTACSGGTSSPGASNGGTNSNEAQGGTTEPPAGSEDAEVELRIMWWGDQKRADITNEVLKLFQEEHPNIRIIGEFSPATGYFDKLNTQLASGTAADVFFLGGNVVDYATKDVLLDLEPYVGNELDLSDMDEAMIEYGTLGGKLVHVSAGANARGIVLNERLFEEAGIPLPEDGWNWEDYARISNEIASKLDGVYGSYNFTVEGMDIYLKQNGKQLYDMENNELGFEEGDIVDWFNYWEETAAGGGIVTPELAVSHPQGDTSKSLVVTGQVAMGLIPSNQLAAHQSLTEDKLTMVQVPRGEKGTGVVFESSQGLSGYAKTEHPKEVAMLINFFINNPEAAKILGNDRGVPVTAQNRALLEQETDEVQQIVYDYTSRVSEATKNEPFNVSYNMPGNTEFTTLAEKSVQEIGFGRKSVEQAVTDFYSGTVRIFNSNKQES